ncbi:MAG: carbohydrate ABC transporter permease [Candidatus Rokuibacteriota bacterium]
MKPSDARPRPTGAGKAIVIQVAAAALVLMSLAPFGWMLSTALKSDGEVFAKPPTLLPQDPTWGHFEKLFAGTNFLAYFRNSLVIAGWVLLLTMVVASPGAYSLARFRYRGRDQIAVAVLMVYMLAPITIIIPFFLVFRQLGLANTHLALVVAQVAFCFPFALWLLRSFFLEIPFEYEEAALIDGAGRIRAILHIVVPLALPGVIATGVFTFILSWNDFIFARVLITSDRLKTLPVGIQDLYFSTVLDWGMFMAAGTMVTLPVLVFFLFVQRYLIAGWGTGGIKA